MKKVYTSSIVAECDLIKTRLESDGVRCMLKNEHGSMSAGIGYPIANSPSLAFAWPEVWVNDGDEEEALKIIASSASDISPEELEREAMDPKNGASESDIKEV